MESPEALRKEQVAELLNRLASEDYTLENIADDSGLELLLDPYDLVKAEEELRSRYFKYLKKYKGTIWPTSRMGVYEGFRKRVYIDAFLRAALGHLGIAGPQKVDYYRVAFKVMKALRNKSLREWPQILEKATVWWSTPVELDPKIAKVITILTAKVLYQLLYGKFKVGRVPREILYPDLEEGAPTHAGEGVGEPRA